LSIGGVVGVLARQAGGRRASIVRTVRDLERVQIALLGQGYYQGAIDGVVGPGMRAAFRQFQGARNLPVTGTITADVLDALRVATD